MIRSQAMTWTDRELEALEKRIKEVYERASKEVTEKMERYLERFAKQDEEMAQKVIDGIISKQEYAKWRTNHFMMGKNWEAMRDTLTEGLVNSDKIASKIINESLVNVYAENANYEAYQIEKDANVGLSFSLYDKNAVENLLSENPNFIPTVNPKIPVDERWNRQHIASEMLQGILQGESIPKISRRLANVTTMDKNGAIRNARTYTTSVENKAKMDRYTEAEDMGIELEKEWMATLDERTRESHRELDGERRANDEAFSNGCMYPADPSGDPEEIYNCRCRIVARIKGHNYDRSGRYGKFDDTSYEEWKKAKAKEEKEEPKESTNWIDRIKEIQQMDNPTEADIKEAGKLFADQVHSGYLDNIKAEKEQLKEDYEKAKQEYNELYNQFNEIRSNDQYRDAHYIHDGYKKIEDSKYFDNIEEAEKYYQEQKSLLEEISAKRREAFEEYNNLYNQYRNGEIFADSLSKMLSQVREVGSDGLDIKAHLNNSRSQMRKNIEWAYEHYPTDWVRASIDAGNLSVKKVDRGYYSNWQKVIAISGDGFGANRTSIHELGHRFEYTVEGIRDAEKAFYERRTAGEELKWLGAGYARDEKSRFDDFLNPYMGKDYKGTAYELVSMGFEYAYTDPIKLAQDSDMESWIYGLLATR